MLNYDGEVKDCIDTVNPSQSNEVKVQCNLITVNPSWRN